MPKISRREFVRVSALTAAATVAAACAQPTTEPDPTVAPEATTAPAAIPTAAPAPTQFAEAPMLAEMVANGELPTVDERLPENPDVMPVCEMIGNYGGTISRGFKGVSDKWGPTKMSRNNLTWYNLDLTVRPSLAESWEINEDASVWTWHLRPGTKWSDGTDFTTKDFVWYMDYQVKNETLTPAPPAQWSTGAPAVLSTWTAEDDYTITMSFADPNPLFAYQVIGHQGPAFRPSEYMKQYHPDFVDQEELTARALEAGYDAWDKLYLAYDWWYMDPARPCIFPWMPANSLAEELFVMKRNPYFWQVDPEGNQLPYIDEVKHRLFETPDVFNMWIVNGEIDFQGRHVDKGNFTLFKESEENGEFRVFKGLDANHFCFTPNLACQDERLREFFGNTDVRKAFSLCVNRDELNELVFDGQGTPRQYSPLSMSPQAYPEQANAYIEYDPETANALLDGAGYSEKDAEGYRLYKDGSGETLSFTIEGQYEAGSPDEDAIQAMIKYFHEAGIKCAYKYAERSLFTEHYNSNQIDATCFGGDRVVLPIVAPVIFGGTQMDRPWSGAWGLWKNNPNDPNGEEPPADHWIWDIWAALDAVKTEPDEEKRNELFRGVLDIWAEELPMIGYLGEFPRLAIVKNGLRNYLEGYPVDDITKDEHILGTQTLFWEHPEEHGA